MDLREHGELVQAPVLSTDFLGVLAFAHQILGMAMATTLLWKSFSQKYISTS
jgi:hypothetical protein